MRAWRLLPISLTALLGIAGAVGVFVLSVSWDRRIAIINFENRAAAELATINGDLADAVAVLDTLHAFLESDDTGMGRDEFARFATMMHRRTVGLRDLGWAPRVADEARPRFEESVRAAGFPDFEIREVDADHKLVRAASRQFYYPVLFTDNSAAQRQVLGLDLAYDETRQQMIERGIPTRRAFASHAMSMVSVPRPRGGVIGYEPVYGGSAKDGGVGRAPSGLVFGIFDIAGMLENIVSAKRRMSGIDIYLYDPTGPVGDRSIYWRSGAADTSAPPDERRLRALPHWEGTVAVIDQRWGALFLPTGGLPSGFWSLHTLVPPVIGLLLTGMVMAYLTISLHRTTQLEALTGQLQETSDGLRRQAEKNAHLTRYDPLTDLPNRVAFHEGMRQALAHAERGMDFALLSVDLDRFKQINDTLGHPVGDALLRAVAVRLCGMVRAADTVARLGGDEFAVIQVDIGSADEAAVLAQRIIDRLSEPYDVAGHRMVIGATVGIALGHGVLDADTMIRNGDLALYRAKQEGRGVYRFFEPEMDARAQARRHLEGELRSALDRGEFELFYQPLISVLDRRVSTFEALIRWRHPERGLVPPDTFISLTEEIGLIVPIGAWVLRTACMEAAAWPTDVGVAVNVSPVQFARGDVLGQVTAALQESGLPASRLEVEITETALLVDGPATLTALRALRTLGVRISMDDFGTGYSSLSYLRSFPFDKLKIDRSFIRDLNENEDGAAIVRAIAGMGQSLGIATVAEGVETEAQMRQLVGDGCTELQGYLFSRPLPASELPDLMLRYDARRRVA